MELRDYLSIRRAYNLVRQELKAEQRLIFAEFAILCRLQLSGGTLNTSEIAEYQQSLRPTMTHRTKHLERLGMIERAKGEFDRRNVVCKLTPEGEDFVDDLCRRTREAIAPGRALSRINAERVARYVDSMGAVPCMSGDLILLGLYGNEDHGATVSELVDHLGLLQPTVSMSATALEEEGLLERSFTATEGSRAAKLQLSHKGLERVEVLADQISDIVVRRKPRTR